jgi:hypothetical protein
MNKSEPIVIDPAGPGETQGPSYVPRIDDAELLRRNQAAIRLLDSWEQDGDEEEQRETLAVLKAALGEQRIASSRNLFP